MKGITKVDILNQLNTNTNAYDYNEDKWLSKIALS